MAWVLLLKVIVWLDIELLLRMMMWSKHVIEYIVRNTEIWNVSAMSWKKEKSLKHAQQKGLNLHVKSRSNLTKAKEEIELIKFSNKHCGLLSQIFMQLIFALNKTRGSVPDWWKVVFLVLILIATPEVKAQASNRNTHFFSKYKSSDSQELAWGYSSLLPILIANFKPKQTRI